MEILYSNIFPLQLVDNQENITDCFKQQANACTAIEIAVGYASQASLVELDEIVHNSRIQKVILIIGMYFVEGIPEAIYHTAMRINERWQTEGIGEVRLVRPFKYRGKLYAFYNGDVVSSVIIGSANLGVIKLEASNRRQYEVSALTTDPAEWAELARHIRQLAEPRCSTRIDEINNLTIVREENQALSGIELVEQMPQKEADLYKKHMTNVSFVLPIKVPAYDERHMDDNRHYTKSNLNVSYAAPRSARKPRDWYETQFTVSKRIREAEGYPVKNVPFMVVMKCIFLCRERL